MATRITITHKEKLSDGQTVTFRVDINDTEHEGPASERLAAGSDFFTLEWDSLDERDPFSTPVQKSYFTLDLLTTQDDVTNDVEMLEQMLADNGSRFTVEFFMDEALEWVGPVRADTIEYQELILNDTIKIGAADLHHLEGKQFPLVESPLASPLISIISDCLLQTGLELPIRSFTNLTNNNFSDQSDDFLRQIWHQRFHFRRYRGAGDEDDQPMKYKQVLEEICRAYNLIIRQAGAVWRIEQVTAIAKGDATQYDYNAHGSLQGSSAPDRTTHIATDSFKLNAKTSRNRVTAPAKRIISRYNHKTLIGSFLFAPLYTIGPFSEFPVISAEGVAGSEANIFLSGRVEVDISAPFEQQSGNYAEIVITGTEGGVEVFSQTLQISVFTTSGTTLTRNFHNIYMASNVNRQ